MTTREDIQQVFDNMAAETDWDLSGPMLWGYFFTHNSENPLKLAGAALRTKGYEVVDVFLADNEDAPDEAPVWFLHVEQEGVHTVDSLLARCAELEAFAASVKLDAFDGWDVGPVGGEEEDD
jgi:hypothetical protein